MYCVKGNSSWYISCRPLFGGCPLLGVSVIGGSTVYLHSISLAGQTYCVRTLGRAQGKGSGKTTYGVSFPGRFRWRRNC